MKFRTAVIGIACAIIATQSHAGSRALRTDNPFSLCNSGGWTPNMVTDPNAAVDGNADGLQNSATFFSPGTVIGPPAVYCVPRILPLASLWAEDQANDFPNPASLPDSRSLPTIVDLTAVDAIDSSGNDYGAIMYYWPYGPTVASEGGNNNPANLPDAAVVVWTLPPSTYSPGLANGGLDVEFDQWCSVNGGLGAAVPPPPSAAPSFTWNGNLYLYTATCGQNGNNFNGDDVLLNPSGVLIGYVDLTTNVSTFAADAPGWAAEYQTTATLALSPATATFGAAVTFQATVATQNGAPTATGTVNFFNGTILIGSSILNGQGVATFTNTNLAPGTYSVSASYVGVPLTLTSPGIPTTPTSFPLQSYFFSSTALAQPLTVLPPPPAPTVTINISPSTIIVGQTATVTWTATNASACMASGAWSGAEAISGTLGISPTTSGDLSYALSCTGAGGTASATAPLTVNAVPTATISVSPTTISVGESATLTWSSTNATSCTASGAWAASEATSGTSSVSPATSGTLDYTLSCSGAGGTASTSATLTVNAAATSKGGGGIGVWELLGLGLIALGRWRQEMRRPQVED
jgi:hypothetical protein